MTDVQVQNPQKLTEAQLIGFVELTNKSIAENIKLADAKAVAVVATASLCLGVLEVIIQKIMNSLSTLSDGAIATQCILMIICGVLLACTFWDALHSQLPRTDSHRVSFLSFPDIAAQECDQYELGVKNLTHELLLTNYCSQNFNLSKIAVQKFFYVKRSIKFLLSAILSIILLSASLLYLSPEIFLPITEKG